MKRLFLMVLLFVAFGAVFAQDDVAQDDIGLMATTNSGLPEGYTEATWLNATADSQVSAAEDDMYEVTLELTGLVPEGLYTVWAVTERLVGMNVEPAGGLPGNEFSADADGNATHTMAVPADNGYDRLVVAYHADDMTHGDNPGAMGEVTFSHVAGPFPNPSM